MAVRQARAGETRRLAYGGGRRRMSVPVSSTVERWGALWQSCNVLDGETKHPMWDQGKPVAFRTRSEAREWIEERYGYIRTRPDLRAEPFGWRMPRAVRIHLTMTVVEA